MSRLRTVGAPRLTGTPKRQSGGKVPVAAQRKFARARSVPSGRTVVELPYPLSANDYWKPKIMYRPDGTQYAAMKPTDEAQRFKLQIKGLVMGRGHPVFSSETAVRLVVRRSPCRRGDLGNCLKVLEDALNCVLWVDDSQTTKLQMEFIKVKTKEEEGVTLTVETRDRERPRTARQMAVLQKYKKEWEDDTEETETV